MPDQLPAIFKTQLPAHLADPSESNIVPHAVVNALTFEGKTWAITLDGNKTKLMKKDEDGEEQPVQVFTGILLDYNKDRGRSYYEGVYDPKKPKIPDCWSEDSVRPLDNVPNKQAKTCAACPKSAKGSAQTADGKGTVACSQFQKLAFVPTAGLMEGRFPPLRLTIKITSIYDKSGQDSHPGWYAFQQYLDLLTSNGVKHTGKLPTKIKFDPAAAYPKLLFSPGKDWLSDEQWAVVKELSMSDEVKALLAETFKVTETTGTKPLPEEPEETELVAAPIPAQARPGKAKPVAAPPPEDDEDAEIVAKPADDDDGEDDAEARAAAKRAEVAKQKDAEKAVATKEATAKAAALKAAPSEDEDEGEAAVVAAPPVKATKANGAAKAGNAKGTPAKEPVNAPKEVAAMLSDWGDD